MNKLKRWKLDAKNHTNKRHKPFIKKYNWPNNLNILKDFIKIA